MTFSPLFWKSYSYRRTILRLYGSIIWIPPVAICSVVFLFFLFHVLSICLRLLFRSLASLLTLPLSHETLRNYCPMKLDVIHVPDVHDSFTARIAYNDRTREIDAASPVKDLISDIPDINARNRIACAVLHAKSWNRKNEKFTQQRINVTC